MALRPAGLNVGITGLGFVREVDDFHLPTGPAGAPLFLPEVQALDEILRPETLDERLTRLITPDTLDGDLMSPPVMAKTRRSLAQAVAGALANASGAEQRALSAAAQLLETEMELDAEIREALAELLRA